MAQQPPNTQALIVNQFRQSRAWVVESLDNWLMQEMGIKDTFTDLTYDPYLSGVGGVYVGYAPEGTIGPRNYDNSVKDGLPFVTRMEPQDILVPCGAHHTNKMRWFARRIYRPLSDVMEDRRFKVKKDEVLTKKQTAETTTDSLRDDMHSELELVESWEFHDAKYKTVCDFQVGGGKFLRKPTEDVDQVDGLPLVDYQWVHDTRVFWGKPLALDVEPLQGEFNEMITQIRDLRTTLLIRLLYNSDVIDPEAVEKIVSGYPFIAVDVQTNDIKGQIMELTARFPQELLLLKESLRQDLRELSGISRVQMGETTQGRHTATEHSLVAQAHETRIGKMRSALADALCRVFRKVNQHLFLHTPPRVVPVIGADALMTYVSIKNGDEIKDEFDIDIDAEEMAEGSAVEQQQLMQLLPLLGKVPGINLGYFLKELFKRYKWMDVQQAFPSGGSMSLNEFAQKPGASNEQVQGRVGGAMQNLGAQ